MMDCTGSLELLLILLQRPLFGVQGPLGLLFGIGVYFSIPSSFTSGQEDAGKGSITSKLASIDYLGAITLVCHQPLRSRTRAKLLIRLAQ